MLSVGAVREQGVIDTIRNGEFGFVKPVDRSEVIYFKVDDVVDQDVRISEGMEVDFFVIVENSKGASYFCIRIKCNLTETSKLKEKVAYVL
jgi:cold shock CspA family protein